MQSHKLDKSKEVKYAVKARYTFFFYKQSIFDARPENCLSFSKKSS